ncbi:energy transducer TonB [Novosphingobium sp.]|uniref:energy transducer TonB n=1 Tax=Novosphingobium sp. TaxID=1874826 RepID=UPI003BA8CA9F
MLSGKAICAITERTTLRPENDLLPLIFLASAVVAVPQSDPKTWITADDYPETLLTSDKEGALAVALEIDEKGQPFACKVVETSGEADLDATTCSLLTKRARFSPARDKAGRPIKSTYTQSVSWKIPREKLITQGFKVTFAVEKTGELTNCQLDNYGFNDDSIRCDPEMIDTIAAKMLPNPLVSYRSLSLLLAVEVDQAQISIPRRSDDERVIISRALFDVSPNGVIASCKSDIALSWMGKPVDLCHGPIEVGSKDFDPAPDGRRRQATVTFELAGTKR